MEKTEKKRGDKMKIYCFYLVRKHISTKKYKAVLQEEITMIGDNECVLYAYTPEKSSELYFLATRNMEMFFEKVVEMDREDYEDYYEEHKEQVLEFNAFNSKQLIDGKYKTYSTQLLCTRAEADLILFYKEDLVMEYISALMDDRILEYLSTHPFNKHLSYILDEFFMYTDILSKIEPLEDINYDNFMVDDLSLYIKLFSNTFKR